MTYLCGERVDPFTARVGTLVKWDGIPEQPKYCKPFERKRSQKIVTRAAVYHVAIVMH